MVSPTHIVMPVRGQCHLTERTCQQLMNQPGWERCWIFDNGSEDRTWQYLTNLHQRDRRFNSVHADGRLIYDMWNLGLVNARYATMHHPSVNIAFINNDLELAHETISLMGKVLDENPQIGLVYPDYDKCVADGTFYSGLRYTAGTYRHGGMSGFCFMLRSAAVDWTPLVDPRFMWWGGDDDIAFNLEDRGWLQARLEGVPVDHLHEGTARHHDLGEVKAADMARIIEKWGR